MIKTTCLLVHYIICNSLNSLYEYIVLVTNWIIWLMSVYRITVTKLKQGLWSDTIFNSTSIACVNDYIYKYTYENRCTTVLCFMSMFLLSLSLLLLSLFTQFPGCEWQLIWLITTIATHYYHKTKQETNTSTSGRI